MICKYKSLLKNVNKLNPTTSKWGLSPRMIVKMKKIKITSFRVQQKYIIIWVNTENQSIKFSTHLCKSTSQIRIDTKILIGLKILYTGKKNPENTINSERS